jgi:glutamate racemase
MDGRPIGVFDSGVGGLAVLWALAGLLPDERLVYHADAAHFPYGERSEAEVRALSLAAAERLVESFDIKQLVVACNTATSVALSDLRLRLDLPVTGIEPAIRPAVARTRVGRIGVLATRATAAGTRLSELIAREAGDVEVLVAPAPALVEAVEQGLIDSERTDVALRAALEPLRTAAVDVVVLGCTHFAFVGSAVQQILGPGVTVLEPAGVVARQAARVLAERDLLAPPEARGSLTYTSSGDVRELEERASRLRTVLYPPPEPPLRRAAGPLGGAGRGGTRREQASGSERRAMENAALLAGAPAAEGDMVHRPFYFMTNSEDR